jgi:hypothetical protein
VAWINGAVVLQSLVSGGMFPWRKIFDIGRY